MFDSHADANADEPGKLTGRLLRFRPVDYIFFLTLDPKYEINPNEVSDTKWVSKADLEAFFQDPGASPFNPNSPPKTFPPPRI